MRAPRLEKKDYRSLTVIIPVYNERSTVAEIVRRVREVEVPLDAEEVGGMTGPLTALTRY